MNYLKNNICKFTPLFKINYNIKKNLICCCFFKMYNKGYKDFNLYLKGLSIIYNYVTKFIKDYTLRIFIDNTIIHDKKIMNFLKKMNKLEIVKYECPNFLIENTHYHEGLIGTLIRFFPMFDFPNNDAKNVFITDIDTMIFKKILKTIKYININKINDIYVIKIGNISKNVKYKYNSYKNIITPYSIAQCFVSFMRINNNVIINFINDVKYNNTIYSYYYDMIIDSNFKNSNYSKEEFLKKFKNNTNFIYGVDEYFINKTFTEYLIDNKMPFAIDINFGITSLLYYILDNDIYKTPIQIKLLNKLIDKILKKYNIYQKLSLKNKHKIINNIHNNSELKININEYIYREFIKSYKKDEYNFIYPKYLYDFLLSDELFGSYDFNMILFYNTTHNNIVISKNKFDDIFVNKLKKLKKKYVT